LDEINNGIGEGAESGEIHHVAATIVNFPQNRDWVVIRGGRPAGDNEVSLRGAFRITFKSIKIHLIQ
jgi:hypothetical protein